MEPYQISGNIDQQYGGVLIQMDGGASFHIRDYTENWRLISTDVETTGCNPKEQTPVYNANIHSWSIAYFPTQTETGLRGQPLAKRVFFYGPPRGLAKEMLESNDICKVMHQSHYDTHAFLNGHINCWAQIDTLRLSRLLNPHHKQHGLKKLMLELLDYKMADYKELFSDPLVSEKTGKLLKKRRIISLDEVLPFTQRFCALADYASLDSKGTLEVAIALLREVIKRHTYQLPEYMSYYYGIEPQWVTVLQRFIGAP